MSGETVRPSGGVDQPAEPWRKFKIIFPALRELMKRRLLIYHSCLRFGTFHPLPDASSDTAHACNSHYGP